MVVNLLPEVTIIPREFATNQDPLDVEDFFVKSRDMRVFVLNMYVDFAKRILCEVSIIALRNDDVTAFCSDTFFTRSF